MTFCQPSRTRLSVPSKSKRAARNVRVDCGEAIISIVKDWAADKIKLLKRDGSRIYATGKSGGSSGRFSHALSIILFETRVKTDGPFLLKRAFFRLRILDTSQARFCLT